MTLHFLFNTVVSNLILDITIVIFVLHRKALFNISLRDIPYAFGSYYVKWIYVTYLNLQINITRASALPTNVLSLCFKFDMYNKYIAIQFIAEFITVAIVGYCYHYCWTCLNAQILFPLGLLVIISPSQVLRHQPGMLSLPSSRLWSCAYLSSFFSRSSNDVIDAIKRE